MHYNHFYSVDIELIACLYIIVFDNIIFIMSAPKKFLKWELNKPKKKKKKQENDAEIKYIIDTKLKFTSFSITKRVCLFLKKKKWQNIESIVLEEKLSTSIENSVTFNMSSYIETVKRWMMFFQILI